MHIPVFDTSGKLAELIVPDVYYSPDSKYNLISCAQLEDLGYDVQFSKRQICTPTTSIAIARVGNVYALANAGHSVTHAPPRDHALPAVGRMTKQELWHRRLMHTSYDKLHQTSQLQIPGFPALPRHTFPCTTCQDANITRVPRPDATDRDTCDAAFDMFDMTKCPTISGQRYCTMICIRKTRYTMVFLHEKKDETSIQQVWTKALAALGPQHKPRIIRCDGAGEYVSPKFRNWLLELSCKTAMHTSSTRTA